MEENKCICENCNAEPCTCEPAAVVEETTEEVAIEVAPEAPATEEVEVKAEVEEDMFGKMEAMTPTQKQEFINNMNKPKPGFKKPFNKDGKRDGKKNFEPKKKLLEEKVVSISRVTKVTKGGRNFRFSATMVVGDGKGLVGIGTGKSNEVPEAIKKGIQAANKNLVKIALIDGRTIPHEAMGRCGRAQVLLKPAREGSGIIAGGAARAVLELAGVKDVVSKSLGSQTQVNVAKATLEGLMSQRTPEHVAALRGKSVEEL